jgi:Rho GDP-dissociation inhibitor
MTVDKTEAMLGSYGPQQDEYTKIVSTSHAPLCEFRARLDETPFHIAEKWTDSQFASEESPSGMLARSGSYAVKSRLIDDDKQVWLDFEWGELLTHPGYPTC